MPLHLMNHSALALFVCATHAQNPLLPEALATVSFCTFEFESEFKFDCSSGRGCGSVKLWRVQPAGLRRVFLSPPPEGGEGGLDLLTNRQGAI